MTALSALVAAELDKPVQPEVAACAAALAARYGAAAEAVLFYGSCLWAQRLDGLMLDFYLLVDSYEHAYARRWMATANRLIPPNVFYFEHGDLRAKYAVLTIADFHRLCGPETRAVSVWARFAQPSALVWVRDAQARGDVVAAVARAAPTLLVAARPLLPTRITVEGLWTRAFALTYDAELRSEKQGRGATLFDSNAARYRAFTAPALAAADIVATLEADQVVFSAPADAVQGARDWAARRRIGKWLTAIRLIKASATFDGGIDYLAWKIARHSGVAIDIKPWMRRVPLLAGLWLLPQLRRKGAVR